MGVLVVLVLVVLVVLVILVILVVLVVLVVVVVFVVLYHPIDQEPIFDYWTIHFSLSVFFFSI